LLDRGGQQRRPPIIEAAPARRRLLFSEPAGRGASARAFTLPWKRKPPRSKKQSSIPLALARSAIATPTLVAASTLFRPTTPRSFSSEEADTRVTPFTSSIN